MLLFVFWFSLLYIAPAVICSLEMVLILNMCILEEKSVEEKDEFISILSKVVLRPLLNIIVAILLALLILSHLLNLLFKEQKK